MKRIHVVAGILRDAQGRVLLAQRGAGKHLEGLWEFPGGKVDDGESPVAALRRELDEEIGVDIDGAQPLIRVPWRYPGKHVELDVYEVTSWRGEPHGREGQAVEWCAPDAMQARDMPEADRPVVTALRLPRAMFVTPPLDDPDAILVSVASALGAGIRLVQLRMPGAPEAAVESVARRAQALATPVGATLVVNGAPAVAARLALGLHLGAAAARALATRPVPRGRWFGVSAHDAGELAQAVALDADYVVVGPVHATATHPGAAGIGWAGFEALVRDAAVPCFAIGGLAPRDLAPARAHGGFGVAGIRAFAR